MEIPFKERVRKALREMVVCGVICSIIISMLSYHTSGRVEPLATIITGFLFSPILWIVYRVVRFTIGV